MSHSLLTLRSSLMLRWNQTLLNCPTHPRLLMLLTIRWLPTLLSSQMLPNCR